MAPVYPPVTIAHCAASGTLPRRLSCEGYGAFFMPIRMCLAAFVWWFSDSESVVAHRYS
jgi:hypothetical protein